LKEFSSRESAAFKGEKHGIVRLFFGTPTVQNVPRANVPDIKCPKYKTSKICPNYKTSQLQNNDFEAIFDTALVYGLGDPKASSDGA
jgi:hypothetical protein